MDSSVLLVSDFPSHFSEKDLINAIIDLGKLEFSFKWRNDTETLLVFKNSTAARNIYIKNISNPKLKIDVYNEPPIDLSPRPVRTDVVARRMVAGALGLKFSDRECPKLEKAIRDKKSLEELERKREQELDQAWEE